MTVSIDTQAHNARPFLVALNAARWCVAGSPQWRTSKSLATGTDDTDAGDLHTFVADGHNRSILRGATAGTSTRYLLFDLGANCPAFDCILLSNIGYGTLNTVTVEVANADTFATCYTVATATAGGTSNIFWPELYTTGTTPRSYSGVPYMAITVTNSGASAVPFVGEVWLGQRIHLPHGLRYPCDPWARQYTNERFTSESGVITTHHIADGLAELDVAVRMKQADVARFETFIEQHECGRLPFLWVPRFAVSAWQSTDVHIMHSDDPEYSITRVGWGEYQMRINATEQPIAASAL